MAQQSQMQAVLDAALALCREHGGQATTDAISILVGAQTRLQHKRVLNVLSDLLRQGRLTRVQQGVYGPPANKPAPDKREVMWRILRMRRRVQVADLIEMAGVSKDYAREWLRVLVEREVVRKHQSPGLAATWQLINDTYTMPEDEAKAARLRDLRRQKKQAAITAIDASIKSLQAAGKALSQARDAITIMEEI